MTHVWVSSWQQQCCGTDFRVGSAVDWLVASWDDGWLTELLGAPWAHAVPYAEDHHDLLDAAVTVSGVVATIDVLTYDLQPVAGDRGTFAAVPGTGRLESVAAADKWAPRPPDPTTARSTFAGWIVGLDDAREQPAPVR